MDSRVGSKSSARQSRAKACAHCRKKKIRCDRNQPCSSCVRSSVSSCVYATGEVTARPSSRITIAPKDRLAAAAASIASSQSPADCRRHVKATSPASTGKDYDQARPEERWHSFSLGNILVQIPFADGPDSGFGPSEPPSLGLATETPSQDDQPHSRTPMLCDLSRPIRGTMIKTAYASSSHSMTSISLAPQVIRWLDYETREKGGCWRALEACHMMSKQLTTNRMLTRVYGDYGSFIPQRSVADRLIGRYLDTFEKIYRVVHVPSFRRCYDLYWSRTNDRPVAFVLQMQLCMALGALSYDDDYSLRPQALQWIREATFWLEFGEQARMTISTLQTMCLLGLARSMNNLHGDQAWVFAGALIRSAMSIGMHRDPTKLPGIPNGEVEMRRRIWATILELTLDSCLDAGGLPLIATSDFDCAAPMNVNDEDFDPAGDHSPVSRRPDQLTDISLQIALGHSFETRLAIVNFSNGLGTLSSYERALSLSSDYTAARRTLASHLRAVRPGISKFERQYCEMLMSRYMFALHMPYAPAALQDPKYLYSRSICADTAVKLLHSGLPFQSAKGTPLEAVRAMAGCEAQCDEYIRLALCASGPVRSTLFQAIMAVSGDLLAMVDTASNWVLFHDRSSLRTVELLSLLQMSIEWARGRILCGQANVKDYVFLTATFASVEARMAGDSEWEKMQAKGLDACIEAKKILEGLGGARAPSPGESACWQGGLGVDDCWTSYLDGLDTEFLVPLT